MRSGQSGDWTTDRPNYDKTLVRRLMSLVAYGGRKGRRAFLRLWQIRIRPRAMRAKFIVKGFELSER